MYVCMYVASGQHCFLAVAGRSMHKLQGKDSYDMNNMSQCSANLPRSLSYISCQEIQRPCVVSDLALWPPVDKNCISVWPCSACTCDGVAMHVRACMHGIGRHTWFWFVHRRSMALFRLHVRVCYWFYYLGPTRDSVACVIFG